MENIKPFDGALLADSMDWDKTTIGKFFYELGCREGWDAGRSSLIADCKTLENKAMALECAKVIRRCQEQSNVVLSEQDLVEIIFDTVLDGVELRKK